MGTGLMLLHNNSSNNPSADAGTLGRSYKAEPFYIPALDLPRPPAPKILPFVVLSLRWHEVVVRSACLAPQSARATLAQSLPTLVCLTVAVCFFYAARPQFFVPFSSMPLLRLERHPLPRYHHEWHSISSSSSSSSKESESFGLTKVSKALEANLIASLVFAKIGLRILYQPGSSSGGSPEPFLTRVVFFPYSCFKALNFVRSLSIDKSRFVGFLVPFLKFLELFSLNSSVSRIERNLSLIRS